MLEYADFAYQTGLVDLHGKNAMRLFELLAKEYFPHVESKIVSDSQYEIKRPFQIICANIFVWPPMKFANFSYLFIFCQYIPSGIVLGHDAVRVHSKQ